jgi:hypothetical protein
MPHSTIAPRGPDATLEKQVGFLVEINSEMIVPVKVGLAALI